MHDLHIKASDAMDHSKWRKITGGKWSERSSDCDAVSCFNCTFLVPDHPG